MFKYVENFKMNGAGRNKEAFIDDERDVVFMQTSSAVNVIGANQTNFLLRLGAGRAQKGGNVYHIRLLRTSENGKSVQNIDINCIDWGSGAVKSDESYLKQNLDYIKGLISEALDCLGEKWKIYKASDYLEYRFNKVRYKTP